VGDGAQGRGSGQRRGAVFVGVLLVAVAHLKVLLGRDVVAHLGRAELVGEGDGYRLAVEAGKGAAGGDRIGGIAFRLFPGGEEVRLVLDDGTTQRGTVLLALVGLFAGARGLLGFRLGVQALIAEEAVGAAGELVGAGLGDHGQDAAGRAAVLGL